MISARIAVGGEPRYLGSVVAAMVDVAKVLPVESAVKFSPSKENVVGGDELLRSAGKLLKRILVGGDAQPLYWPVRRQKNGARVRWQALPQL